MSDSISYSLPQYINPQHTDKLYNDSLLDQSFSTPRASTTLSSPFVNTPTSHMNTRGLTLDMSDASSFMSEPSSANSLGSSPGCLAPSSCSSNSSSRRHSMIMPETHQYYQASPTPTRKSKTGHQQIDHNSINGLMSPFSDPMGSSSASFGSDSFHSSVSDGELLMATDMYQNRSNSMDWQYANAMGNLASPYDPGLVPMSMSMDLAANFDASMSGQIIDGQVDDSSSLPLFTAAPRHRNIAPSRTMHQQHTPILAEPFEPLMHHCDRSTESYSPPLYPVNCRDRPKNRTRQGVSSLRRVKVYKSNEPRWRTMSVIPDTKDSKHRCGFIDARGTLCGQKFRRPEHLKRHERKHLSSDESNMLRCHFYGVDLCKKFIKDRPDNMRAHLKHTHFTYGKTEGGGKNKRFSMRASHEMGLRLEDERWTLLLQNAIHFGDTETRFYKMLGYSIKDTAELAVKDIAPEWEGPEDAMLKDFDPRWKQLLSGNMTFEQAMERGRFMPEEEKEGLLGVDMATSAEMGLRELDPRWRRLEEGKMTLETSEKLGVKHLNPIRHSTASI